MSKLKKFFIQKIKTQLDNQYGSLKKITVMGIGMLAAGCQPLHFSIRLGIKIVATDLHQGQLVLVCLPMNLKEVKILSGNSQNFPLTNLFLLLGCS